MSHAPRCVARRGRSRWPAPEAAHLSPEMVLALDGVPALLDRERPADWSWASVERLARLLRRHGPALTGGDWPFEPLPVLLASLETGACGIPAEALTHLVDCARLMRHAKRLRLRLRITPTAHPLVLLRGIHAGLPLLRRVSEAARLVESVPAERPAPLVVADLAQLSGPAQWKL